MTVRSWTEKDVPIIAEMEKRCFKSPFTEQMLLDTLKYPIYQTFLAEEGGQVCGYASMFVLFERAEIANVAVDAPYRRQGIGKILMDAMHQRAKALGAEECLLEVRTSNAPAIALYEGYGYIRFGVRAQYYPDGEDAILMKKDL